MLSSLLGGFPVRGSDPHALVDLRLHVLDADAVEVAADVYEDARALALAGRGLRELSLGYAWIPAVKKTVRNLRMDDAQKLAQRVMDSYNPADVRRLIYDRKE